MVAWLTPGAALTVIVMSSPDLPPPVSPIHGPRAEALGFPAGVQVMRLSNTGGTIGSATAESWAAVTEPPRNLLLGWAERVTGTDEWRIIAEAAPGSGALAALFDQANSRAGALAKLAELARLTLSFALAHEGPAGHGPYVREIAIGGRLYRHRPITGEEADDLVERLTALRDAGATGEIVEAVMAAMREVMEPAAIADMIARLRRGDTDLEYSEVVDALTEIVRRQRAAEAGGE